MASLHIRPASLHDAAEIARVHVASWRETYDGILPDNMLVALDVDARREMWASVLVAAADDTSSAASIFVLEQTGRVTGFSACGDQRSAELAAAGYDGEIGAIYILNQARRLGAGRSLMRASATALSKAGKKGLSLWVLTENGEARRFYERLSGHVVGERSEPIGAGMLNEVAYGWPELNLLIG